MNLLLDLGNSTVKAAVTDCGAVVDSICENGIPYGWIDRARRVYAPDAAIWCSTRNISPEDEEYLSALAPLTIRFLPGVTEIPVENMYDNKRRLGADRLALAVGVSAELPGKDCLIFDFGTALTVDFLTADGKFMGGCISPGLGLRLLSLHEHTAALPLISPDGMSGSLESVPSNTRDAVSQGVWRSMLYEVEGHMSKYPDAEIVFSGNDAKYFANQFNFTIFAESDDLLLKGLDVILEHCRSKRSANSKTI